MILKTKVRSILLLTSKGEAFSEWKAMRRLANIVKINFFRTLEISQRFATSQGAFIKEKWLTSVKTVSFVVFSLAVATFFSPISVVVLKNINLTTMVAVKMNSLAKLLEGTEQVWSSPESCIPRKLSLFDLSGSSLERHHSQDLSLFDRIRNSLSASSTTPSLLKTTSGNCLTLQLPEPVTPDG